MKRGSSSEGSDEPYKRRRGWETSETESDSDEGDREEPIRDDRGRFRARTRTTSVQTIATTEDRATQTWSELFFLWLVLRHFKNELLMSSDSEDVQFCGYSVPHPADSKIHLRIEMHKGRAIDALKKALQDLVKVCDHTITTFNKEMLP